MLGRHGQESRWRSKKKRRHILEGTAESSQTITLGGSLTENGSRKGQVLQESTHRCGWNTGKTTGVQPDKARPAPVVWGRLGVHGQMLACRSSISSIVYRMSMYLTIYESCAPFDITQGNREDAMPLCFTPSFVRSVVVSALRLFMNCAWSKSCSCDNTRKMQNLKHPVGHRFGSSEVMAFRTQLVNAPLPCGVRFFLGVNST